MRAIAYLILILIIFSSGCREHYEADIKEMKQSFLVVEGNLDPGQDTTLIRLTRTFPVDGALNPGVETNAQLIVEGKDNTTQMLTSRGNGEYFSPGLNLILGNEYRLRIKTFAGKEYVSDYVKAQQTPSIDSISWERDLDKGMWIYANTHDPSNATRYYRWDYEETWEIHSAFYSTFVYENGTVRPRVFPDEEVFTCWRHASSVSIPLANSTRLKDDIIYKAPLTLIPNGSDRLSVRYSILVSQYALSKEAYNFYELMKKNTEEIGSIFSAQPSELRGNFRCVSNPEEYVLGYLTASTVEEKRVFIIPNTWNYRPQCESKDVINNPDTLKAYFGSGTLIPYNYLPDPFDFYPSSFAECVDCRLRGGTKIKPSYW